MYLNKINLALLKTKYLNKLSFSVGGVFGFSPLDLFKNGEQGVWYDPSDLSTLFQDAAGTIPVTSDGDPVGLMLDKSQGLKQGEELISNGMFESGLSEWGYSSFDGTNGVTLEGGSARVRSTGAAASIISQKTGAIQGKSYLITFWTDKLMYGGYFRLGTGGRLRSFEPGVTEEILKWDGINDILFFSRNGETDFYLDNVSVKEIKGNHATQSVSASRPTYRTDGTLHWLEFDGVDDYLSAGDVLDILDENIIMCAGYYGSRAVIAGKSAASNEAGRYFMPYNNDTILAQLSSYHNVGYAFPVNSALTTTMQVLRGSTNTLSLRKNGSVVASSAMTPDMTSYNTSRPFWIGAYPDTSENIYKSPMDGNLYGLVTVRKSDHLGAKNLDYLEGYISDKSGVTL